MDCEMCLNSTDNVSIYEVYSGYNTDDPDEMAICEECFDNYIEQCHKCGIWRLGEDSPYTDWHSLIPADDDPRFENWDERDKVVVDMETTFFCDLCVAAWRKKNPEKKIWEMIEEAY